MKKYLLAVFALLPLFSICQVYNELVESPGDQSAKYFISYNKIKTIYKKKHWPDSLKDSYNSYDDFSITEKYDISGNPTEYNSTYNVFDNARNSYSYKDDKLISKKISYSNSNGQWITETKYKYNGKGKLTGKNEVFTDVYGKKETTEQTTYYYDSNDRPSKSNVFSDDSSSGKLIAEVTFTFNDSGNLTGESEVDSTGKTVKKYIYIYDDKNRLLNMKYFWKDMEKPNKEYGYKYGQNNDTLAYYEKKPGYFTDTTHYTYNEKKQLVETFYHNPAGPDHAVFTYDFTGLLYEKKEYLNYRKKTTTYTYDGNNLQTLIVVVDENDRYLWGKELSYEFY